MAQAMSVHFIDNSPLMPGLGTPLAQTGIYSLNKYLLPATPEDKNEGQDDKDKDSQHGYSNADVTRV